MHIRPYAIGEENALLAIFQSAVHGLASGDYTTEQIEAWAPTKISHARRKQWTHHMQANQPWVVEIDGELAAFADLQASGYVDHFFVAEKFAYQGIGSALMRHLLEQAASRNISTLFAHVSLTAQPFFGRFGFLLKQRRHIVIRDTKLINAVMYKASENSCTEKE